MSEQETPGGRLRAVRRQQGLSAEDLAARIGISPSAVRNQENGTNGFSATRAAQYAQVLGLSPQWLLYGDESGASRPAKGLTLTSLPNGKARLEVNQVLPMAVALQILTLIEGAKE